MRLTLGHSSSERVMRCDKGEAVSCPSALISVFPPPRVRIAATYPRAAQPRMETGQGVRRARYAKSHAKIVLSPCTTSRVGFSSLCPSLLSDPASKKKRKRQGPKRRLACMQQRQNAISATIETREMHLSIHRLSEVAIKAVDPRSLYLHTGRLWGQARIERGLRHARMSKSLKSSCWWPPTRPCRVGQQTRLDLELLSPVRHSLRPPVHNLLALRSGDGCDWLECWSLTVNGRKSLCGILRKKRKRQKKKKGKE